MDDLVFESRQEQSLLQNVETGSGTHPASCSMGTGTSSPWGKAAGEWGRPLPLHLVPGLRMNTAIPLFPLQAFMAWTGTSSSFRHWTSFSWKFWPSQRPLHFPRSWTQAIQFWIFIWQMSCLMLSSHLNLDLPCDLLVRGFQLTFWHPNFTFKF